jgi:hypothetical protein
VIFYTYLLSWSSHFKSHCNQKEEGPKTPSTLAAFNEPGDPCFPDLLHTNQTSEHTQQAKFLLTLSNITESKAYKRSVSTRQQHGLNSIHFLPFQIIQMPTWETFLLHLQTMYNLRKHKLYFPSAVHKKKTDPRCCLLSHSSVVARLITRHNGKLSYSAKLWLLLALFHTNRLFFFQLIHS